MEFGLANDQNSAISDEDLKEPVKQFRELQPYCGLSMLWGNLRARGFKVTGERVCNMLRSIDPLGRILRCFPSTIMRQPYSVPGPNSLWHIGKYSICIIVLRYKVVPLPSSYHQLKLHHQQVIKLTTRG